MSAFMKRDEFGARRGGRGAPGGGVGGVGGARCGARDVVRVPEELVRGGAEGLAVERDVSPHLGARADKEGRREGLWTIGSPLHSAGGRVAPEGVGGAGALTPSKTRRTRPPAAVAAAAAAAGSVKLVAYVHVCALQMLAFRNVFS